LTDIKFLEFSDFEKLSIAAAKHFVVLLNPLNKQTLLLAGGKTSLLFYKYLAKTVDDWTGTTLLLSYERLAPQGNIISNVGMLNKQIMKSINAVKPPRIMAFVNKSGLIEPNQILASANDFVKTLFPTTAVFE
tara:strand:+ start:734 stop:1132 length:399 start_codon:yes stop_codon:yes gene_type:complete